MIKGMTLVHSVGAEDEFDRLSELFSALGFETGKGWKTADGRGAAFLAPLGNLEIVTGTLPGGGSGGSIGRRIVLIEVTQIDQVRAAVERWMVGAATGAGPMYRSEDIAERLTPVEATSWGSRMFQAVLGRGAGSAEVELRLGFWELEKVLHGRPVAVEGDLSAAGMKFAVVVARWNAVITDRLLQGALDGLLRSGAARGDVEIVRVPGAWEIPGAARTIAERQATDSRAVDAVVTLGCLLRGETAHYEAIYTEVARGIGQSQQETGVPHSFGVLTCETLEQALDRAGLKAGNKGFEAAIAAIEMVSIQRKLTRDKVAG